MASSSSNPASRRTDSPAHADPTKRPANCTALPTRSTKPNTPRSLHGDYQVRSPDPAQRRLVRQRDGAGLAAATGQARLGGNTLRPESRTAPADAAATAPPDDALRQTRNDGLAEGGAFGL
ncbi:hypothetical protein GCM10007977_084260 [Dactylosporangium sucinum]|uniref:Uncharacterized protein n=1 Tax=Dactylosporangium sucinum TaxID=1424081 RepID=A0A917UA17_9ACTN|nr:hypothetical protein GCM10007977_084260 [Dactylosporangium sucinum]